MTRRELKEQLDAMLEALPEDKATLLLDFAAFLSQQANQMVENAATSDNSWDDWEREVIAAEEFWFNLPMSMRLVYSGKTVAVMRDRILDADGDPGILAARIDAQYPDRPVLYIEADADRLPALMLHSPRFG